MREKSMVAEKPEDGADDLSIAGVFRFAQDHTLNPMTLSIQTKSNRTC
jgi:hypothetical protein